MSEKTSLSKSKKKERGKDWEALAQGVKRVGFVCVCREREKFM